MAIVKQYDKRRNVTYFYESHSQWIPELGQPRAKRKLIGKLDPVTGKMIPTARRGMSKKSTPDDTDNTVSEAKSAETKLIEENTELRQELVRAMQEIDDLTKTVKSLTSKNQILFTSISRISSKLKKINEEIEMSISD